MRKLSPAYVVTTVVIAVAGTAFAQSAARPAGTTAATSGAKPASVPTVGANRTNGAANGEVSGTFNNGMSTSTGTNTSTGSTSANPNTTSTSGSTSTGINGSRSGTTSTNGTTTTNEGTASTGIAGAVLAPGVVHPAIINGTMGGVVSDGERVFDTSGNVVYDPNNQNANASIQLLNNGSAGAAIATDGARNSQSLDKAIKQAERDRKKIGRNGQLLQSIAPRTSVDRSEQMPDDGPSPALSGSASALNRR